VTEAAQNTLALDYGERQTGAALAQAGDLFAKPLVTLSSDETLTKQLIALVAEHRVKQIVVGWPRNLDGERTDQSRASEQFAAHLRATLDLSVVLQDEALTSQAAAELLPPKMPPLERKLYEHQLAAKIILEDYLAAGQK